MIKIPLLLTGLGFFILLTGLFLINCESGQNYLSPEGPRFTGKYAVHPKTFDDTLKVASFNIQFSEKIEEAIYTLRNSPDFEETDILLLQEMDETGTEIISKALGYDYVYYPATIHPQSDKNFGNAILSIWPINNTRKILLPHEFYINKTRRIAVAGTVSAGNWQIRVFNVHIATIALSEEKRLAQVDSVMRSISGHHSRIIVGGDFNTIFEKNIKDLDYIFTLSEFIRASKGSGLTIEKGPLDFTVDHIYTKGFHVIENGIIETEASDHNLVWVKLVADNRSDQ
ncbi:MAG: hypothetical protein EH225_00780 [Calditrichaeota bacterium]|nr:endonuclease/exonuclease/phosphatase family protein [Calditrichota bacterium]RQV92978.1 MAG: hypothetical protein EH221_10505 [bacterium]RQW08060.1 MAG: hypothetical protein EH225_00780 [Calditrichota bacterium]